MPQSPYRTTIYPPIDDVHGYRRDLARQRADWEDGNRVEEGWLLDAGDELVEHCEFLEAKLAIRVPGPPFSVALCNVEGKRGIKKEENQVQKLEIAALKSELEKREGAKGAEEQLGSNSDGTVVEANVQDVNSEFKEADKLEEGKDSQGRGEVANSGKRGSEMDAAIDSNASKKARTVV
ncbi:hypothetical protein GJ744_010245 [Endocarpon pusillum]|uniref:Uncharacterized protein n=1 Tax=Endocarpon pusillum TaxID=364733 RepID=A0A8H7AGZ6_9EURO|nr:hypothetical protein GJ744_010245 [Endocarpon pusillum]